MIITQEITTFLAESEPHFDQSDRFIEARKPFDTKGYSPFRKYGLRRSERPSKERYFGPTMSRKARLAGARGWWKPVGAVLDGQGVPPYSYTYTFTTRNRVSNDKTLAVYGPQHLSVR